MLRDVVAAALIAIATIAVAWQLDRHNLVVAVAVAVIAIIAGNAVSGNTCAPSAALTMAGGIVGVAIGPLVRGGASGYLSMPAVLVAGVMLVAAMASPRFITRVLAGVIAVNLYPMSDTIPFRMWPPFLIQFLILTLPALRNAIRDARWSRWTRLGTDVAEPLLLSLVTWLLIVPMLKERGDALPLLTNYYLPVFGVPAAFAAAAVALSRKSAGRETAG
ncbi:MAG: hypothetical protein JO093_15650 [Acidobacteria bacterium]|nr:hypothetical protein [Acidobacteriota bacterium]MBV9070955.1 hypothetical protein [Acidobacteriota bacterium]MBV9187049.1 hypothetical protein [Acidobacteriota bacterium]